MICYICGLNEATICVKSERGQDALICDKCHNKKVK